jgi:micrococcal nuclease
MDLWNYRATVTRIVDADTLDVNIDLGFQVSYDVRLRIARIDAPEIFGVKHSSEEYQRGITAKSYLEELIPVGSVIKIKTEKTGKYGRYIAELFVELEGNQVNVSDRLVETGHAVYRDY